LILKNRRERVKEQNYYQDRAKWWYGISKYGALRELKTM